MKIAVLVKPVPDTTIAKAIDPQTRRLIRKGTTVLNPMDEFAVEAALRVQEQVPGTRVELVAMAPESAKDALRKGLGMGADAAVLVSDAALAGSDAAMTATVLIATLRKGEYDAVFCGVASSDGAGYYVPRMIAAQSGRPFIADVAQVRLEGDGFVAEQNVEGMRRTVRSPAPVVLTVSKEIGAVRYPSLKGIMAAKSKPLTVWSLADLEIGADAPEAKMVVRDVSVRGPRKAAIVKTATDPDEAAREIAAFMRSRGFH